jgi:hypothetical protein
LRTSLDVVRDPDIRRLIEVWVTAPNLWITGSGEQFCSDSPHLASENRGDRDANAKRPGFQFDFP